MNYYVSKNKMEAYLNLQIEDNDLFPDEAPSGTSFYDLKPENDDPCIVKPEHVIHLLDAFVEGKIDDARIKDYVETVIALDLYVFDESSENIHDLISNTIFTLDELKDVNGLITKEDARQLRARFFN